MLSKKIIISLVMVPTLWISYAVVVLCFTDVQPSTVMLLFLSCPLFSYVGIMATEAGVVDAKDLRPAFMRLLPSMRKQFDDLPRMRAQLQQELRTYIKKVGPDLGPLYFDENVNWSEYMHRNNSSDNLAGKDLIFIGFDPHLFSCDHSIKKTASLTPHTHTTPCCHTFVYIGARAAMHAAVKAYEDKKKI
jgi:hypothetical protein